jgi:hypothetical protein
VHPLLIENNRQRDNFFILNLNLGGCCKSASTARFLREFLSEKILFKPRNWMEFHKTLYISHFLFGSIHDLDQS